jgi:hypothetical protein
VFEKLRADWRRGRALKQLKLGERQYWEWESNTEAGTICANLRFSAEGETLVLRFLQMWSKVVVESEDPHARGDLGLGAVRAFLDIVAQLGADCGFTRMRVEGQRTRQRRKDDQNFEFPLDRYLRGQQSRR